MWVHVCVDLPTIPCVLCVSLASVMVAVTANCLSWPLIYSRWRFGYCPAQGAALTLDPWPLGSALCPNHRTGLELLLRGEATWGLDQTERFVCGNGYSHNSRAPDLRTHNQFWFTRILIVLERLGCGLAVSLIQCDPHNVLSLFLISHLFYSWLLNFQDTTLFWVVLVKEVEKDCIMN